MGLLAIATRNKKLVEAKGIATTETNAVRSHLPHVTISNTIHSLQAAQQTVLNIGAISHVDKDETNNQ